MVKPGVFISDRYEVINKIGSGGMADVFKARDHRLNRFVAIKILKQEYSEDKKFVDKFRGEAQSAAGLSHPNIVNVYDVGEEDELYYIVMELVEGITLKSFIERKGKLDVREATGIAIQIAQGMDAAHQNHIIHRDIKPQNIIISKEGKVKVTDFGIAKATTSNTITSNAMGSVHYISPEQARGGYSDEKSDIYSLGVTMYEMLCGQVPFIGDNTVSVALSHIQEEAVPLRNIDASLPVSIDRIVQKCMQKKPERRYLSASALIADLKKSLLDPDGDFVQLTPTLTDDSPTINLSEEEVDIVRKASAVKKREPEILDEPEIEKEEKDGSEMDPKLEKIMIIGGIAAAVILALVIFFIIGKALKIGGGGEAEEEPSPSPSIEASASPVAEEGVEVPELKSMTQEQAEKALENKGLVPHITEEYSELYEEGYVSGQNPAWGEMVEEGSVVEVIVSKGPEVRNKAVPSVAGMSADAAEAALNQESFVVTRDYKYSDTVEEGKAISTDPSGGTQLQEGSTVTLYISKGKEIKTVAVPDLSGKTPEKANEALAAKGLTGAKASEAYSDTVKSGTIISQNPVAGTEVNPGTQVTYVVSLGKEVTYTYESSFTFSDNPFEFEDDEPVTITATLDQDGNKTTVYSGTIAYDDIPLTFPVEGSSKSDGEITIYIDGKKFNTYHISFEEVAH